MIRETKVAAGGVGKLPAVERALIGERPSERLRARAVAPAICM
ncbi:hypothetical protein ACWIID_43505 [Streptomyces phaeochromogenes]